MRRCFSKCRYKFKFFLNKFEDASDASRSLERDRLVHRDFRLAKALSSQDWLTTCFHKVKALHVRS